jgi:hypothetical protein
MNGRRNQLGQQARSSSSFSTPGSYPHSIDWVNTAMQHRGVGLSQPQFQNMSNSINQINRGAMGHAQASAREARVFARDVANPILPRRDRAYAALGVVANGVFGPAYHASTDISNYHMGRNQSPDVRRMMAFHLAGSLFD